MKPVNTLPVMMSQDTDFKAKDSSVSLGESSLGESNKGSDFSKLVQHHSGHDASSPAKRASKTAKNDVVRLDDGKKDTSSENTRQESDLITQDSTDTTINSEQKSQSNASEADREKISDVETSEEVSVDEDLLESEQFISMLYNSDKTLTNSSANVEQLLPANREELSTNDEKLTTGSDELDSNKDKEQLINKLSTSEVEHKLKSFSPEELLNRANLKREALTPQPNDAVLKEYQQSLASQNKANSTEVINNEVLLDNDSLIESDKSGKFEGSSLNDSNRNKISINDSEKLNNLSIGKAEISQQNTNVDNSDENADIASEVLVEKVAKNTDGTEVKPLNNKQSIISNDKGTEQVSQIKVDKLTANQQSIAMPGNEQAFKEQVGTAPLKVSMQQPNVSTAPINAANELQQKQTKADLLSTSELKAVEEAAEEFIDLVKPSEEKPLEPLTKTANTMSNSILMRPVTDVHAQNIHSTQSRNEAYVDFQSSEILNHTVATDTAHIQKNNVQLQQETISMFRKDFADAVKDKVMVMINQKIQQFEITLDPPEFGNMHVRVNLQGEQAAVNFVVQNQQAKEALEQNMHKLKDMLAEQGVDVGGANVEQQNQQDNSGEQSSEQANGNQSLLSGQKVDEHNVEHILSTNLFDSSPAGIDYYA